MERAVTLESIACAERAGPAESIVQNEPKGMKSIAEAERAVVEESIEAEERNEAHSKTSCHVCRRV
jgi:hypothetical protein